MKTIPLWSALLPSTVFIAFIALASCANPTAPGTGTNTNAAAKTVATNFTTNFSTNWSTNAGWFWTNVLVDTASAAQANNTLPSSTYWMNIQPITSKAIIVSNGALTCQFWTNPSSGPAYDYLKHDFRGTNWRTSFQFNLGTTNGFLIVSACIGTNQSGSYAIMFNSIFIAASTNIGATSTYEYSNAWSPSLTAIYTGEITWLGNSMMYRVLDAGGSVQLSNTWPTLPYASIGTPTNFQFAGGNGFPTQIHPSPWYSNVRAATNAWGSVVSYTLTTNIATNIQTN